MLKAALRWILPSLGVLIVGPLAGRWLAIDPTLWGLAGSLVLLLAAGVLGLVTSVLCGTRPGLNAFGLTLLGGAWVTDGFEFVFREGTSASTVGVLGITGLVVALAGVLIVVVIDRVGTDAKLSLTPDPFADLRRSLLTKAGLATIGVGAVAALAAAWLVGRDFHRGQAMLAAIAAGIAAGGFGGAVGAGLVDDDEKPPMLAAFLAMAAAALIAPLIALGLPGLGKLPDAVVTGSVPGLLRLVPLDWAVGALVGVPIGLAWGGALAHPEHHPQPTTA